MPAPLAKGTSYRIRSLPYSTELLCSVPNGLINGVVSTLSCLHTTFVVLTWSHSLPSVLTSPHTPAYEALVNPPS